MQLFRYLLLCLLPFVSAQALAACPQAYSLPVNLNNYYNGTAGLSGDALKTALNIIIRGHSNLGYGCAWDILRLADEDPLDSDNVIGFYTRRAIAKTDRDYGQNTPNAWNREHIWAKSHGISSSNMAAHNDAHHLRATDKSVNADRASKDFAGGGAAHWECSGCRYTATSWEPPDVVKGDTARMMFYMAARYEGGDGVPDLQLVDQINTSGSQFGDLCDMLQWHLDDPVDSAEQSRNDIVYSFQGNRNPFIDYPDFAVAIWGESCGITLPPVAVIDNEDVPFLPAWAVASLALAIVGSGLIKKRPQ